MTKERRPLSVDAALARIAGEVGGWAAMARETGYIERTVRKWGDEKAEEPADIPLRAAIKLDMMFQRHGGEGRPLYDVYGLLLGSAVADAFTDQFELLRRLATVVRENGQAEEALVRLSLPGATEADRRVAEQELVEAVTALKAMFPFVSPAERPPEVHQRAPPASSV